MPQQEDYIGDDIPNHIKEVMQTKGIHREILEVRNLKAVTNLATETVKSLKNQNWVNLSFLIFGSLFSVAMSNLFGDKKNEALLKLVNNQKTEINDLKKDYQNNLNEQNKLLLELKNQLSNIKKQQKP